MIIELLKSVRFDIFEVVFLFFEARLHIEPSHMAQPLYG